MKPEYECRECQTKHLRAALAYATELPNRWSQWKRCLAEPTFVGELSRAAVLFAESAHADYRTHADLAIGFLVKAEETGAAAGVSERMLAKIRDIRLVASGRTMAGKSYSLYALERLHAMSEEFAPDKFKFVDLFYGHLLEAQREGFNLLPGYLTPEEYIVNFEEYIKAVSADADPEAPQERKEGETDMACGKRSAAKGGKTAKSPMKAGKCNSGKKAPKCKGCR